MFLIITLLTVAVAVTFNQWLSIQLIEEADTALLISAAQIADRIDEFNRSNQQAFNVGSKLPDLVDFLRADEAQRIDPDFRERTLLTLGSLQIEPWDEYYLLSQAIIDRDGQNILDTAAHNIGTDESQQDYFRAALLGGAINISPVQYRPERSGIYFYYAVPLRDPDPPTSIIGVLRIQVSVASVQNIVFENVRGEYLDVTIFDSNYVRIVDTQHEELLFRSIAEYSPEQIALLRSQYAIPPLPDAEVSVPIPDLVYVLANSHQDSVESAYMTPDAKRQDRVAIVHLDTVPWHLIVTESTPQYYETVQRQTTGILILAISLTILALLASYLISKRITEPIRTLTAVAKLVAEGRLDIKAPITGSDEVGTLANTFNLMTTELEQAHATLEERVEKRTQELLVTNEKLKHEIIERQRYEKQALELALEHERTRILSEFIQNASHEFKTPLSIININSHLAKRILPDDKQRLVNTIEEQSRYIDGLVGRMVLMSRLDSGMSTPLECLNVDDFIRTIYTGVSETFKEKQVEAHLDLQSASTWVCADPELLSIAMQNVLDNTHRHSSRPVRVLIKSRIQNEQVSITIRDNGIGIPPDLKARVFERFFRVDEAHSTRGFGLGLPIAKRIIENVGGSIALDSEVGAGTTVTITLGIIPNKDECKTPSN